MVASFLLALREGLEAALIVGIVIGALRRISRTDLVPQVWRGALLALIASGLAAGGLTAYGLSLKGPAEGVFEGVAMLLAACVLTWMIFWMNRQARQIKPGLEAGVRRAVSTSGRGALFTLAFVSVVREGVELALFLTASAFQSGTRGMIVGGLLGLAVAASLGWALFASTLRLDLTRFFRVTGLILLLLAAGMVGQAVHEFNELGWVPAVIPHVWDLNLVLSEGSTLGQVLKSLLGYSANPALTEVIAYLTYLAGVLLGLRRTASRRPALSAQAPA